MRPMKPLAFVLGTRPEIVKLAPVIRAARVSRTPFFIVHTNQHYSPALDAIFMRDLAMPRPRYNLRAGRGTSAEQIAKMLPALERIFRAERPGAVVVQGDTNSVFAGAFAARREGIPVAHVEAGLRSYDERMPEETNRVLTDHMSTFLFAPTPASARILRGEGIRKGVHVTGNTVVDALVDHSALAKKNSKIFRKLGVTAHAYALATFHRAENVDAKKNLEGIIAGLDRVAWAMAMPCLVPLHPRTVKRIREFKLKIPNSLTVIPPLGYLDFLALESLARLILTDSGGVQEEACVLKVPCVTLRENTERPETVRVGGNMLAGTDPSRILRSAMKMKAKKVSWKQPFGDGKAGERIIRILKKELA